MAHLAVVRGGAPCAGSLEALALTEQDGVTLEARFSCPATGTTYKVRFGLFDDLARGHRHIARELGGGAREDILFGGHDTFEVSSVSATPGAPEPTSHAAPATFPGFLRLGVEHILTGYDHLVFLFGLVLVRSRPRALLAVVTAFTVAHSLTLGLATLGVWAPSPRFVEPAIALSIAYVGVENLLVKDANRRWRITFPFGLVHGFGFAGALREVELPRARIPLALVGFNVGVELAQIAALAVLVPLVLLVSRRHTVPRVTQALSVLVAVAGLAWFIARRRRLKRRSSIHNLGLRSRQRRSQRIPQVPARWPLVFRQPPRHSKSVSHGAPAGFLAAHLPRRHSLPASHTPPGHASPSLAGARR
ncbi:MAG: HupE/UreJ family protein [Myxococcales bacterium]|nr:HupE/UreJ family protein [Myxococcales bacterium]